MAVHIRLATHADIPLLAEIERAAGELFRAVGMVEIADDDPLPDEDLRRGLGAGLLWVAAEESTRDAPVAYLLASVLDGDVHIDQVTVHPDHAGQRLGARLIDACEARARQLGVGYLTLTTFRDIPWNAPYYRRLGFEEMPSGTWSPALHTLVRHEDESGIGRWPRLVMRREVARAAGEGDGIRG